MLNEQWNSQSFPFFDIFMYFSEQQGTEPISMKWLIFHIGNWSIKAAIILTLFKSWNAGAYAIWWSLNFYRIYEPGSEAREYILHWQDRLFCHFGKFPPLSFFDFLFLPSTMGSLLLSPVTSKGNQYMSTDDAFFTIPSPPSISLFSSPPWSPLSCWRRPS